MANQSITGWLIVEEINDVFNLFYEWLETEAELYSLNESHEKKIALDIYTPNWLKARLIIFTNPSARAGYDTSSIFKRSLTGLNSEFSFS